MDKHLWNWLWFKLWKYQLWGCVKVLLKEEVRHVMCCSKDVSDHMHQQGCEGYNVWSLIVEDSTLLMLRVVYKIVFGDLSSHIEEYRCPMNLDFLANFVFCDQMWSKQNTRKTKCSIMNFT